MLNRGVKNLILLLWLAFAATVCAYAGDNSNRHDNSHISLFVQPAISFLSFEEREYFQDAIDTIYQEFRAQALDEKESLSVAKQDFQKVNFCFPLSGGLQVQLGQDHFISAGVSFIYDNESIVLSDQRSRSHNYSYTIQGVPLFLEYRFAIPTTLMTLTNESLFSVAFRWYWALPGTEIYTTWGSLKAKTPWYGSGFGLSVGYLLANWKFINIYGDIGFSSISVESRKTYADIVPDGPEEKASWNIGGLQLQIRVSFGVWNKPEPVEEEVSRKKDDLKSSPNNDSEKADSLSAKSENNAESNTVPPEEQSKDPEKKVPESKK